jgi:hypothetical protein
MTHELSDSGIIALIEDWDVEYVHGKSTVLYNIHLRSTQSGLEWDVKRRFSEFRENWLAVKESYPSSTVAEFAFPRRTLLHIGGNFLAESRRKLLEQYLEVLLQQNPPPLLVARFLRITPERYAKKKSIVQELAEGHALEEDATNGERVVASYTYPPSPSPTPQDNTLHNSEDSFEQVESHSEPHQQYQQEEQHQHRETIVGRLGSLKVAEEEADDNHHDDTGDHGPRPETIITLSVVGAAVCSLKIVISMLYQFARGELTFVGILRHVVGIVVRNKEDVFLVIKTLIFIVGLGIFIHRILGFSLGFYLRSILSTPKGGFLMFFDWISLRCGFDNNEIVISGFQWKNPHKFQNETKSKFFILIRKLTIRFDLQSLFDALLGRTDNHGNRSVLRIWSVEIDGLDVRIERGKQKKDGLNLWAALGADDAKKADEVEAGVRAGLAKAARDVGDGLAVAGQVVGEGLHAAGGAMVGGMKTMGKGILKYNPVSVVARQFSHKGPSGDVCSRSRVQSDTDPVFQDVQVEGNGEREREHGEQPETNEEEEEETWRDNDESCKTWHNNSSTKSTQQERERKSSIFFGFSDKVNAPVVEEKNKAWGVPFKIEADRFTGRHLEFRVQDFLNASHTDDKPIVIPLMDMDRRELTTRGKKGPSNPGGHRQGVWLDDLTWKIVNRLIADLLKTNSLSLIATVAASGVNNAATGIAEGSHVVGVGAAEQLYQFNPKDIIAGMGRSINRLTHQSKVREREIVPACCSATIFFPDSSASPPPDTSRFPVLHQCRR